MSAECAPARCPVPLIVGFGKACELCEQEMPEESIRLAAMRDRLEAGIMKALEESYLNGHPTNRLPGNLNISFAYVEGESLLMGMKDIALSSGSACTSATLEPVICITRVGGRHGTRSLLHSLWPGPF